MDELSSKLAESITELLKHRHSKQEDLEKRFEQFCNDNAEEKKVNKALREEVTRISSENEALTKSLNKVIEDNKALSDENKTLRGDLEKLSTKVDKQVEVLSKSIAKWNEFLLELVTEVKTLKKDNEETTKLKIKLDEEAIFENIRQIKWQQQQLLIQNQLTTQQQHQQQQQNASSYRLPVRSPSASSFLNGSHRRSTTKTSGYESLDPTDEFSELDDKIENLKQEVDVMSELQRSFDKSSIIYEDEYYNNQTNDYIYG